jgi:hypothetical protein
MKNNNIEEYFKNEINNWKEGTFEGEFGVEDLVDILHTALFEESFNPNEVHDKITETLNDLLREEILEQEEVDWIWEELAKDRA